MKKIIAVFKREYFQAVRKKSFLIMTILAPLLLVGLAAASTVLATAGLGEKSVVVVDGTGRLREALSSQNVNRALPAAQSRGAGPREAPSRLDMSYVSAPGDPQAAARPYLDRLARPSRNKETRIDAVLLIPADAFDNAGARLTYYSRSATDIVGPERLGRVVSQAVSRQRLRDRHIDPSEIDQLLRSLPVESVQVTKGGGEKKGSDLNFIVGFLFAALLFVPMLLYGNEIMRGIIQEKTDRIVEILISSMSPMQLLSGKIMGLAAVGLTQVAIWAAMGALAAIGLAQKAVNSGVDLSELFRPALIPAFFVFYVLGYLIYVCIYAVGGAITNSEKEAQQTLLPVILVVMVPWFLLGPIIMNPESTLATVLSLVPIYTPITMFVRVLVSEPPLWQVLLSIGLSAATIYCLFWISAKIFRLGILSYGKRPTIPELWRWMKVA